MAVAVGLFNPNIRGGNRTIRLAFVDLQTALQSPPNGVGTGEGLDLAKPIMVRDLWEHAELGAFHESFEAEVPEHGLKLLRLSQPVARVSNGP